MGLRRVSLVLLCGAICHLSVAATPGLPFIEDFSDINLRDTPSTTADWNTTSQILQIPMANPLTGTFTSSVGVDVGTIKKRTNIFLTGDVDGDGDLDIVAGNDGARNRLYLNNGTSDPFNGVVGQRFGSRPAFKTMGLALGDIDRDGDLDIVTGNENEVNSLLLNNGTSTPFSDPGSNITADAHRTKDVVLADMDGDGDLDLVAGNDHLGGPANNRLYLNNGTATPFSGVSGVDIGATEFETEGITVGDVNDDGHLDVVSGNWNGFGAGTGDVNRLYLNNGTSDPFAGVIGTPITTDSDRTSDVLLGDVDGDGDLDLIAINQGDVGGLATTNRLYLNNGTADPFNGVVGIDISADANFSNGGAVADVDRDGDLDLVVVNGHATLGHQVNRLYLNDGFANFSGTDLTADLDFNTSVDLADMDGDGDIDSVASSFKLTSRLYLNLGTDSGGPATLQMRAVGRSVRVDTEVDNIDSVELTTIASAPQHSRIDYWVSNNGGSNWVLASPGNEVGFTTAGTDLRWRAEMSTLSLAALPTVDTLSLTLNFPPVLDFPQADQVGTQGLAFGPLDISGNFSDPDGDVLRFGVTGLPVSSGLSIDTNTGVLSGTPTNADALASPIAVTIIASDNAESATDTFELLVNNINDAPVLIMPIANQNATEATPFGPLDTSVNFSDPDGDILQFSVIGLPVGSGLSMNTNTGVLSGTPTNADALASPISVTITAADAQPLSVSDTVMLAVTNVNDDPFVVAAIGDQIVNEDALLALDVSGAFDDIDGDTLSFSANGLPASLSVDPITGIISGTPVNAEVGDHAVTVLADDANGGTPAQNSFMLTVINVNDNPVVVSPIGNRIAIEDALFSLDVSSAFDDIDVGDVLSYGASGLPLTLTIDAATGVISGIASNADVGVYDVIITADDGKAGLPASDGFTLTVDNTPDLPSFTSTAVTLAIDNSPYFYAITTSDPDPLDSLDVTVGSALPAWLFFAPGPAGSGLATLFGTPGNGDVGVDVVVSLIVTDATMQTVEQNFTITVANANDVPQIDSAAISSATEGQAYLYDVIASDIDVGDVLTITAVGSLPGWLTLQDAGNGTAVLSGTPTDADVSLNNDVTLRVTDLAGTFAEQSFTININDVNNPPQFSSTPLTDITEATFYSYLVVVTDLDNADDLTITADELPSWLTLTQSGSRSAGLTGTPTGTAIGDVTITLRVGDGNLSSVQMFTITVNAAPEGPVLEVLGDNPMEIDSGTVFTDPGATASDPQDGDLTSRIVITNPVNSNVVGRYVVIYSVTDSAGLSTSAQRVVNVITVSSSGSDSGGGGGGGGGAGSLSLMILCALHLLRRRRRHY